MQKYLKGVLQPVWFIMLFHAVDLHQIDWWWYRWCYTTASIDILRIKSCHPKMSSCVCWGRISLFGWSFQFKFCNGIPVQWVNHCPQKQYLVFNDLSQKSTEKHQLPEQDDTHLVIYYKFDKLSSIHALFEI